MSEEFRRNRRIRSELSELERLEILDATVVSRLQAGYPVHPVSLAFLGWLLLGLGSIFALAGTVVLLREPLLQLWEILRSLLAQVDWWIVSEISLLAATAGLLWLSQHWKHREMHLRGVALLELFAAFAFLGFTSTLAAHHSHHDGKWPHLLAFQAIGTMALAYALSNRGILWLAAWITFTALGAETGYWSGWGAYWLGMDVPERVLAAGILSLGLALAHTQVPVRWKPFLRVYLHYGLLLTHLSLWFLAIFGSHFSDVSWSDNTSQRLFFTVLWAGVSGLCLWGGHRTGLRLMRGYGMTFLVINLYTFYFQFVVARTGTLWFWHLLLVGASLVALGFRLERMRKER
jgi:hypothetical protein